MFVVIKSLLRYDFEKTDIVGLFGLFELKEDAEKWVDLQPRWDGCGEFSYQIESLTRIGVN